MDLNQLRQFKKELKISEDKIVREEIEMIFLNELAECDLGTKIVFYGGTALRLAYNSPRFSEDIDLFKFKKLNFSEFKDFIKNLANEQGWQLSDIKDKRQTCFALLKIIDEKLKHPLSLKVELHKPSKKVDWQNDIKLIKSPVSVLSPLLLVPTLEELKSLKIKAIEGRFKARDIFDLWYISQVLREDFSLPENTPSFKEREFKNELQVFLPPKYYSVINHLYEQVKTKNK